VEDVDGLAAVAEDAGVCTAAAAVVDLAACAELVVDADVELVVDEVVELVVDALDVDDDVAAGCVTMLPIPPKLQALAPCCGPKLL